MIALAAGATYEPIATTTLGSAQETITFSSISSSYTDLILVCLASNDTGAVNLLLRLNSDTGSNYSNTRIFGDGSAAYTDSSSAKNYMYIGISGSDANNFTSHIINFNNYSNTTTYKTVVARSGYALAYVDSYIGLWRNTGAISSIDITPGGGRKFRVNSTFTLYGIKAA